MRRIARTAVLSALAVAFGAAPALAKDLCLNLPVVSGLVVYGFQEFTVPPKGKCKPVSGESTVLGWVLSGAACTTPDGSTLRLGFGAHAISGVTLFFDVGCNIPLPSLAGGSCQGTSFAPGAFQEVQTFSDSANVQFCTATVP